MLDSFLSSNVTNFVASVRSKLEFLRQHESAVIGFQKSARPKNEKGEGPKNQSGKNYLPFYPTSIEASQQR